MCVCFKIFSSRQMLKKTQTTFFSLPVVSSKAVQLLHFWAARPCMCANTFLSLIQLWWHPEEKMWLPRDIQDSEDTCSMGEAFGNSQLLVSTEFNWKLKQKSYYHSKLENPSSGRWRLLLTSVLKKTSLLDHKCRHC